MDRTAMSHNDTAHNGKTQTGSMFLVRDEGLKDRFLILRRDAAAIVTDCQQHPFVVGEDLQCDPAPFLNGVDGVGEQIDKYLFQADRICILIYVKKTPMCICTSELFCHSRQANIILFNLQTGCYKVLHKNHSVPAEFYDFPAPRSVRHA